MRKSVKKAIVSLLIFFFVIGAAVWQLLPNMLLRPYRLDANQHPELISYLTNPDDFGLEVEDMSFISRDSIFLSSIKIKSPLQPAKATIIMLHGIGACKEIFLSTAKEYCELGIDVVLMDNRAHGKSGGEYCTYGYREKEDVSDLITQLEKQNANMLIGLHGISLGGAIAWQTIGNDHRIDFAIIESTFDDLRNVVREYLARFIGFHFDMLADFALWRASHVAHFDSSEVAPSMAAEKVTCPVFCAHGSRDIHIPIQFGIQNFRHQKHLQSEFHLIHGADHNNLSAVGGKLYLKRKLKFIQQNLGHFQKPVLRFEELQFVEDKPNRLSQ